MPENRKSLFQKLAKARQQLKHAQTRVAQLEADLAEDQPASNGVATVTVPRAEQGIHAQCTEVTGYTLGFAQQEALRQQVEASQQRYVQQLEILHEIDNGLLKGRSIEALIEATLHNLRKLIPCQRASVLLIDPTKEGWGIFAVDQAAPSVLGKGARMPIPPNGFASFNAEKIQLIPDPRTWPEANAPDAQLVQEGLISSLRVLLTAQENPIGMLSLSADRANFLQTKISGLPSRLPASLRLRSTNCCSPKPWRGIMWNWRSI